MDDDLEEQSLRLLPSQKTITDPTLLPHRCQLVHLMTVMRHPTQTLDKFGGQILILKRQILPLSLTHGFRRSWRVLLRTQSRDLRFLGQDGLES